MEVAFVGTAGDQERAAEHPKSETPKASPKAKPKAAAKPKKPSKRKAG